MTKISVEKRDGRITDFQQDKIIKAILAAYNEVYKGNIPKYAEKKAQNIANYIQNRLSKEDKIYNIEEISDLVEKGLMEQKDKDVAKAYILYREKRNIAREKKSAFMQEAIEKLSASNVQNQNANVDEHSFGGRKGEADRVLNKKIALDYYVSKKTRENHLNNEVYIHDLDSYAVGMHNCLTIPFDKLLAEGFNTRQMDIRPAGSVSSAFQLVAVIFQLQSLQQFGGCSASHIDWTMVPYVRKSFHKHYVEGIKYILGLTAEDWDDYKDEPIDSPRYKQYNSRVYQYALDTTEKETRQAIEGMYHNLNTLQSRSGNQLPFTSINYGTCTLPEGRMVTKAILEESIKGGGKLHKTYIFPCGIFQCMKGVNRKPGDPNYDLFKLALRSTAQRLYPNYVNVDWSVNVGYDKNDPSTYVSTMGKRKLQLI